MLHHIKKLFGIKPKAEVVAEEVPYKVETPVVEAPTPAKKKPAAKKAPAAKKPRAPRKPKAQ
jgi:hypothetical protein